MPPADEYQVRVESHAEKRPNPSEGLGIRPNDVEAHSPPSVSLEDVPDETDIDSSGSESDDLSDVKSLGQSPDTKVRNDQNLRSEEVDNSTTSPFSDLGIRSENAKAFSPPSVSFNLSPEGRNDNDDLSDDKYIPECPTGDVRFETVRNQDTIKIPGSEVKSEGTFHLQTRPTTCHIQIGSTDAAPVEALLDSCSGMSIMSTDVFNKHFKSEPGCRVKLNVKGIGKQRGVGHACATIFVKATDNTMMELDVEFHLMDDFDLGVCLGMDVISSYNIDILSREKVARVNTVDKTFKIEYKRVHQDRLIPVKAMERTRVKRDSHRHVQLDMNLPHGRDFIFEPVLLSRPGNGFMKCPGSIVSAHTKFLPLSNFSSVTESVSRGQILGYARPISTQASAAIIGMISDKLESQNSHRDLADEFERPVLFRNPELLNNGTNISEFCLVADTEPAKMIDPSDRIPEPHTHKPTYKQFDIARNEHGEPHPEIVKVIEENLDAFTFDGSPGTINDGTKIKINTGDHPLHSEPLRPLGPEKREVESKTIKQLLSWGVIQKSESPANYAVVLVKQRGKWRFCIDYRKLNEVTQKDSYPMQRQDVIFNSLGGFQYFSSLDAAKGFHQVEVAEEDQWKTAFVTHDGLYEYRKMPFGLKCAPAVFQRFMDRLLGSMRWQNALVYIDDVILFSHSISEHAIHIDTLLKAATAVGLKFEPEKCHFGYDKLDLLGRVISREGLSVKESRAKALLDIATPQNAEELYHVIGLFGYYRMFVYGYSIIMEPITRLTSGLKITKKDKSWKKTPIKWEAEQEDAFKKMKNILSRPPVLAYPDWSLPFILYTDACKEGFAFAIHQKFPVKKDSPEGTTMVLERSTDEIWKAELQNDPMWAKILLKLRDQENPNSEYFMVNGLLSVRQPDGAKLCVPKGMLKTVFHDHHDAIGHAGYQRSWNLLKSQCWRPNMATMLKRYIDECPVCQRSKPGPQREGEMGLREITPIAFHTIALDFVTGLPKSGKEQFDAILTIVDLFTKTVILAPLHSTYTAKETAQIFCDHVVRRGFLPRQICSDNDKVFMSKFWKSIMEAMSIKLLFTSPYHPQADPAERYNQIMENVLRCWCWDNPANWSERLMWVELAMNSLKSEATKHTPLELLYTKASGPFTHIKEALEDQGRSVDKAEDFLSIALQRMDDAKFYIDEGLKASKLYYDSKHSTQTSWKVGDSALVLLERRPIKSITRTKLSNRTLGPFPVLEVHQKSLRLEIPARLKMMDRISIQHVKKWKPDTQFDRRPAPEPVDEVDNEILYEIDSIVGK